MFNPKSVSNCNSTSTGTSHSESEDKQNLATSVECSDHRAKSFQANNFPLSRAPKPARNSEISYSAAHIAGNIYHPNNQTDSGIIDFLSQSLSNNAYYSEHHLRERAQAYTSNIAAEKVLIANATCAMRDINSFAHKQAEWLCHLERSLWKYEPALECRDRNKLGDEVLGLEKPGKDSPYAKSRSWKLSDQAASAFSMILKGQSGPFTSQQVKTGFELSQEGQLLAGRLNIQPRKSYRKKNRHDANRSGTHSTKTLSGMDLSMDLGTSIRDAAQVPVMSGTSGSSSDVVIAARYAAMELGVQWSAPELTTDQAKDALIDLSLDFFRQQGPTVVMAMQMNAIREKQGLPTKDVEKSQVFTHSYAEIHSGILLTVDGIDPTKIDEVRSALYGYTIDAKKRLSELSSLTEI
ncbi:hypothetical protein [Xanthomonas hortorum]|uniref:hypothetical protein n=1 Tax=Xanthomonas hortorum TaxID=56454 RepID=UPI001E550A1D|nr:hypothetical protein [Xanthomonas hortorum]MCC8556297.1 hypothetical protein [Xanthomonas hortorum pv. gardneri]MCE4363777.1 hypothetical protein [Xanthomonas hortorum]